MHGMHKFVINISFNLNHAGNICFMDHHIIEGIPTTKIVTVALYFTNDQKAVFFAVFTCHDLIQCYVYINSTQIYQKT